MSKYVLRTDLANGTCQRLKPARDFISATDRSLEYGPALPYLISKNVFSLDCHLMLLCIDMYSVYFRHYEEKDSMCVMIHVSIRYILSVKNVEQK